MEAFPGQPSKIDQYVARVKGGESIESFGDIPDTWKQEIRERTAVPVETPLVSREDVIREIEGKLRMDVENMTAPEIKEQIKLRHDLQYWKRKGSLGDDLFAAGRGHMYENESGEVVVWEPVPGEIGRHFDAHGIAKTEQLTSLLALLDMGIDPKKEFYTAPFELPDDQKAGAGAGLGTGDGTAYKDGIAVLTSGYGEMLAKDGIKHVFLNDVYKDLREPFAKAYPQYSFHLLSEQKAVLGAEPSGR